MVVRLFTTFVYAPPLMSILWFVLSIFISAAVCNIQLSNQPLYNLSTESANETIYFLGPANGTLYLSYENIPFTFGTSDGNSTIVELTLTCPQVGMIVKAGNSSDILYLRAPAPTETCQATITSSPGYNPINYVDIQSSRQFAILLALH